MTQFPYDEFSKNYLQALLETVGQVKADKKVPSEIREIDVFFAPFPQTPDSEVELGLLGRFASTAALFEPFRNAVQPLEVCSCMGKLFSTFAEQERKSRREETPLRMDDLPRLWIISPTASEPFLDDGFHATPDEENWGKGIYFLGDNTRTAIIVVHQLREDPETLWLRLLGRDGTQKRAITELEALSPDNPLRQKAVDLLLNLRATLELKQPEEAEDRDFIMSLSPIYLQKLEEVRQEGRQEGIQEGIQEGRQEERQESLYRFVEKLLQFKFGSLDDELNQIIQPLAALGEEEFIPLIQQLSRSELLDRFS